MRSLRRLSVVSIASLSASLLLCSAGVRAQTVAAPPTATVPSQNAAPFAAQIPPLFPTGQSSPPLIQMLSQRFRIAPLSPDAIHRLETLDTQRLPLLARNDGPCFALRTYGFTAGHDPAEVPRLSSHTTCTPASKSHIRELVKSPSNSSHQAELLTR